MASHPLTVYAVGEYEPLEFDAVLVQERTIVCLRGGEQASVFPLDKVNHVDADPDLMLAGAEIPDSFFGGAEYGFVDVEQFPVIQRHLTEIEREEY